MLKDPHLALVISKKFEDEQQMLDEIHELLSKSIYISNMKYQLSNQNDDDDNRNNNQPLKSVIHWRLEKFENVQKFYLFSLFTSFFLHSFYL